MDFSRTEAQDELAGLTRQILADQASETTGWAELAGAGVLAAGLPEALGGAGTGLLEHCSVLAEIGRAAAPLPYLTSIVLGAGALARFGPPGQQRRWAGPAGRGELILTAALAEDDSDDPRAPAASARRADGGWVLSGVKTTVPAATLAGLFLVPAATEPGATAVFLVSPDDAGVTVASQQVTGGAAAGRLELDGVALAGDRLLGQPDGEVASWLAAHATVGLCAQQLGVVERALELTAEYARSRVQFGRPIGAFQGVAHPLADSWAELTAAEELVRLVAAEAAGGHQDTARSRLARSQAAAAALRTAYAVHQAMGGMSFATESGIGAISTRIRQWSLLLPDGEPGGRQ
jgi:acyl-CoA dehydrogenase